MVVFRCLLFFCCRFAIRPEAFKAEGWLPDPPASYLEALRRQQRLLHGQERRRCLHQHKVRCVLRCFWCGAAAMVVHCFGLHVDCLALPAVCSSDGFQAAVLGAQID
jgi:hypothetical protein